MKRYNLLTEDDLIPNNHYEVISLFGKKILTQEVKLLFMTDMDTGVELKIIIRFWKSLIIV